MMLDLSSPDVWPSTLQKVGKWARQPCIKAGYLPIFDAACLMAEEGYGGLYDDSSRATKDEILGLNEALDRSVDDRRALEGYLPENRFVNGEYQDVYPLIAYRLWVERTGHGDPSYFLKAEAPAVETSGDDGSRTEGAKIFQYHGNYAIYVDRSTPKYALFSRRKSMTVYEFACLYCGIDPDAEIPLEVRKDYIDPLIAMMAEHMELEDDVPF